MRARPMRADSAFSAKEYLLIRAIAVTILLLDAQKLTTLSHCAVENDSQLSAEAGVVQNRGRFDCLEVLVRIGAVIPKTEYLLARPWPARLGAHGKKRFAVSLDCNSEREPLARRALDDPFRDSFVMSNRIAHRTCQGSKSSRRGRRDESASIPSAADNPARRKSVFQRAKPTREPCPCRQ